ncbi:MULTISPECIES: hypothetical protein [unclassified Imperialibacter]|uniref:hypothetical protein n=1 Tax=unclassified Imperialibacter TaxID=2629706 RepID=UPI0012548958|nr:MULTISPECIES: hypothetical protein [unclassified Imperialibacter]CAD5257324.1 conserved hypothetical protein [Imperialibacter sp. 89]CAD5272319.1 conserved hypothetical protein [Imperialibacter sp. 75]VVT32094.1 conserved hypothetical protein [Imperialibacter sp. EC-SDR9]
MISEYQHIVVESFKPSNTAGRHGPIHIRPIPGQAPFLPHMHVRCAKELSEEYPVGTRFRIRAKLTNREGGTPFIHSHYTWPYEVLND